jgi:hypothetical protein
LEVSALKAALLVDAMARDWFGYGKWDAPYWFIGMEPGGDDAVAKAVAWDRLGRKDLLDNRAHHERAGLTTWHTDECNIQSTWGPLIRLLLVATGRRQSDSLVKEYQRFAWGSSRGKTLVAELSSIPATGMDAVVDRTAHREHRKHVLGTRLATNEPTFVIFYGETYKPDWEDITKIRFDADGFALKGKTVLLLALHPTSRPTPKFKYWLELAHQLKKRVLEVAEPR